MVAYTAVQIHNADRMQVMVWRTNFDRHLDDFVLSHIEKGDTQLKHETEIFPRATATALPKDDARGTTGTASNEVPTTAPPGSKRTAAPDSQSIRPSTMVRKTCNIVDDA